jgi:type IV secretory pathway VirB10-like protein
MKRPASKRPVPGDPVSQVFADPADLVPRVGRKDPAWRFALACLGVGCFGAAVFANLNDGRLQMSQAQARVRPPTAASPTPPTEPSATPLPAPTAPVAAASGGNPVLDPATQASPSLVLDIGDQLAPDPSAAALASARATPPSGPAAAVGPTTPDERFSDRIAGTSVTTVRATRLSNTALIAPQGTVIPAVLETALNSDLPGFASALVSRDVRGYDNSTVLIPKGSKLVGQYKSAISAGQSRAFVVWSRLLTPDGVSVDLASPAADELGRGGLAGETNSHFLRRYGTSLLTSVITTGLVAATANSGAGTAIVLNSPSASSGAATAAVNQDANIPDTISVKQGAAIRVFVARDLDFSSVLQRAAP